MPILSRVATHLGDDHIEEWDTRTGEATDLGKPPGFTEWNVLAVDKIGDRVVVRHRIAKGGRTGSVQTRVRDDDGWTEDSAQRGRLVWWQGDARLQQVLHVAKDQGDGSPYALRYDGHTLLTPTQACDHRRPGLSCLTITAPGAMLPPVR